MRIKKIITNIKNEYNSNKSGKQRIIIVTFSLIFLLDYIMFSIHIESNIFDIFPSIPQIDNRKVIDLHIPSEGAEKIITEKRYIDPELSGENLVARLFSLVTQGSFYDNTSSNVPIKFTVKKIWIIDDESEQGKVCIIDVMPIIMDKDATVIKGSEPMFKNALEKTITSNMPEIKKVLILEKGIPQRKLWEI